MIRGEWAFKPMKERGSSAEEKGSVEEGK